MRDEVAVAYDEQLVRVNAENKDLAAALNKAMTRITELERHIAKTADLCREAANMAGRKI